MERPHSGLASHMGDPETLLVHESCFHYFRRICIYLPDDRKSLYGSLPDSSPVFSDKTALQKPVRNNHADSDPFNPEPLCP